jgi:thiol-disulfide isomerase/thioredoxin
MKAARTIIFTLLVLGVAAFLILRHQGAGNSAAMKAIADAKAQGKPVWLFIHSADPLSVRTEAVFNSLLPEYASKIVFINVDSNNPAEKGLLKKYGVASFPTSIYFDSSGKPVEKKIGEKPADEYKDTLAQLLEIS